MKIKTAVCIKQSAYANELDKVLDMGCRFHTRVRGGRSYSVTLHHLSRREVETVVGVIMHNFGRESDGQKDT